ncbi:MAG: hypothetical protein K9J16_01610 [Melioribacteraceae bacterium]|nr:hypothetical protein [Melioribacteraceae bacterium]MCF8395346.1 hypothetical protein [Melioribacteraceae bacterium]MCF8417852.1 hypothetical protein [Melioribacteraceae bacterium]
MKKYISLFIIIIQCSLTAQDFYRIDSQPYSTMAVKIDPSNSDIIYNCTWNAGANKSTDNGETWTNIFEGRIYNIAIDENNSNNLYLSNNGLFKSTDGGSSWEDLTPNLGLEGEDAVREILISPLDPNLVFISTAGFDAYYMLKTTNGGTNWEIVFYGQITALISNVNNPYHLLIGVFHYLMQSLNNSDSWEQVYDFYQGFGDGANIISIVMQLGAPRILYVQMHYNLYKSHDFGSSWEILLSVNEDEDAFQDLIISKKNPRNLFCLTSYKVLKSINSGEDWEVIFTPDTTNFWFDDLELAPDEESLYLSTTLGLYKADLVTDIDEDQFTELKYDIHNYPNPFNPTTNIVYQIPKEGRVVIKLYDILGREIQDL